MGHVSNVPFCLQSFRAKGTLETCPTGHSIRVGCKNPVGHVSNVPFCLQSFRANLHCAPKKRPRTEGLALVAVAEFARIPMQRPMPNRNSCEFRYQPTSVRFPG